MDMLDDPAMKEIVDGFCEESKELLSQLEESLEKLELNLEETAELEKFGQIIDRIMGAAKSIGADDIARFCELGKLIGYKSSQTNDLALLNVVVAILFDTIEWVNIMVDKLQTGNERPMKDLNSDAFVTRLKWLSEKFKDIDRASCEVDNNMSQASIDDLIKNLGL